MEPIIDIIVTIGEDATEAQVSAAHDLIDRVREQINLMEPQHEFLDRGPVISSPLFPPENMVESAPLAKLRRLRPRMFELLEEMARVQTRKAKEYATSNDSYSNYREAGAAVGIPGSRYVESRFAEKQARHRELLNNGEMENTDGGYLESAIDRANTALIALHMHEQENS